MTEKQRLLWEIEEELRGMSEEEKQEVLLFLWQTPQLVCREPKEMVQ